MKRSKTKMRDNFAYSNTDKFKIKYIRRQKKFFHRDRVRSRRRFSIICINQIKSICICSYQTFVAIELQMRIQTKKIKQFMRIQRSRWQCKKTENNVRTMPQPLSISKCLLSCIYLIDFSMICIAHIRSWLEFPLYTNFIICPMAQNASQIQSRNCCY